MHNYQRIILITFLCLTLLILILDNIFPGYNFVSYIKFAIISSLFIIACFLPKKYSEQKLMNIALFLIAVGDFFLVFCSTFPEDLHRKLFPFGVLSFMLAYIVLIFAFQKKFTFGIKELIVALPILGTFLYFCIKLSPYVSGIILYGGLIFGLVLCYITWTSICTIFRGYFSPFVSLCIAIFGILVFICDLGVANQALNPLFKGEFVSWLRNIIWGSYIPAWTLIILLIAEKNLLVSKLKRN